MKPRLIALAVALSIASCDDTPVQAHSTPTPIYEFTFPERAALDPPPGEPGMAPMRCVAVEQLSDPENAQFLSRYIGNGFAEYQRELVEEAGLTDQPLGRLIGVAPPSHFTGRPGDRIQIFADHFVVDQRYPGHPIPVEVPGEPYRERYWWGGQAAPDGFGLRVLITQNAACVFSPPMAREMRLRERIGAFCGTNPSSDFCRHLPAHPE
ncbi:hypothetical protein [Maricaulis sp.]|uniref:hypothetical protein n=1 Tax=Maricaulis sp. TaxID=1486257 RepID=UPI003A8FDA99